MSEKGKGSDGEVTIRGTGIVAGLTLISRLLGFVRDLLVAKLFGATPIADAFFVAFRIPNLLRSFVAEGAMSSAFIPVFTSEKSKGAEHATMAFSRTLTFLLIVTILLTAVGVIFAPQIIELIAPGFSTSSIHGALCVDLTRIMMPYIICVSIVALLNGALGTYRRFGISAYAQVLMNCVLIAGAVLAFYVESSQAAYLLAWSVLLGGIIQVLAQVPALHRTGLSFRLASPRAPVVGEMVKLMGPALIGATVYQVGVFLNTMLASLLEPGSVSWLFYADRVTQFPIGVFTIALASVLLPMLSSAAASGDTQRGLENLNNALRFTHFVLLPICALLVCTAAPIVALLFERGAFSHDDTLATSAIVVALAPGLWATSCYSMLVRVLISRKDTTTPVLIGVASLLVTTSVGVLLMGPLNTPHWLSSLLSTVQQATGAPALGATGLAWGSTAGAALSLLLAVPLVARIHPEITLTSLLKKAAPSCVAAVIGALATTIVPQLHDTIGTSPLLHTLSNLTLFTIVFLSAARVMRIVEVEETFSLARRLLSRR